MSDHSGPIGAPTLGEKLKALGARFKKLTGAVLGGATGVAVSAALDGFGWHIDPSLASAIALVLAAVGTGIAPPNTPKE